MKNIKIVLVVVCLGLVLCSASIPQEGEYKKKVETFLSGLIKGEVDKSYDELLLNSPIASVPEKVELLKTQTQTGIRLYGELSAYEFVKKQEYGHSIVRLVYILKCERLPLTWEFYFYKAVSEWILVNISFSDEFDLLADK